MADTVTTNFKFVKPSFNKKPWQQDFYNTLDAIDAVLSRYILVQNFQGVWQNATAYTVGQRTCDPVGGGIYTCLVAHTSNPINTFAQDRTANPGFWSLFSFSVQFRGAWATGTQYSNGDFVTFGQKLAVCLASNTASASFVTDQANGFWNVIIDGTALAALPTGTALNADQVIRYDGPSLQYQLAPNTVKLSSAGVLTLPGLVMAANSPVTFGNGSTFAFSNTAAAQNLIASLFTTAGLLVGAATGGDKGAGTGNFASHTYVNGVRIDNIAQVVNFVTGASAVGVTVLPQDNTIPQNNEGDQYMSLAITPLNAGSMLLIDVVWFGAQSVGNGLAVALFQDNTLGALAAGMSAPGVANQTCIAFRHKMTAGTTLATTFKVRAGTGAAGTTTFNGSASAQLYGGVLASSITITEVLP